MKAKINDYPALGFNFKVTSTYSLGGNLLTELAQSRLYGPDESFFQSVSGIKATAGESVIVNSGVLQYFNLHHTI